VAEGDTILRAARRIEAALAGETVSVTAPNLRGQATGVAILDGRRLETVEARGKHLLLRFEDLALHSHLGMSGGWHVYPREATWSKPPAAAWAVLQGKSSEAVQFGGPTLRVLRADSLHRDPILGRLGPDILAADFDAEIVANSLRAAGERGVGEALLDQTLVAGIGNIFKSESCFAAQQNPWHPVDAISETQLQHVVQAAHELMRDAVERGRQNRAVYRRGGQPCPRCATTVRSRGQGDVNRTTYRCPVCQAAPSDRVARLPAAPSG
jgi:endonuclease VIII